MHRALSRRAYLLTRQLHTSAGRAATTALRTGAKAAAAPVVVRKGSLFDPEPAPAPPPEVILAEEAEPGLSAEEVEEVQARKDVEDKLVKTLGQKTVQNLLTMIPADLVKHLSEMCIYAGIDQLADCT
ncbi:hypothetical protein CALVIDRAFT_542118 [Calocera viscosa TUFC12733]|uniref:Uncharacterized protein n=1 Tax=Calocera viscosa (strain TUFC12733) TaxID=1330018 RepID=A0A167GZ65_CALVF|nr:hypothetical protein CALVIDRAFT_542118 [Calocera viscosa TUFC12733]